MAHLIKSLRHRNKIYMYIFLLFQWISFPKLSIAFFKPHFTSCRRSIFFFLLSIHFKYNFEMLLSISKCIWIFDFQSYHLLKLNSTKSYYFCYFRLITHKIDPHWTLKIYWFRNKKKWWSLSLSFNKYHLQKKIEKTKETDDWFQVQDILWDDSNFFPSFWNNLYRNSFVIQKITFNLMVIHFKFFTFCIYTDILTHNRLVEFINHLCFKQTVHG